MKRTERHGEMGKIEDTNKKMKHKRLLYIKNYPGLLEPSRWKR
jgi:hypothetical protein